MLSNVFLSGWIPPDSVRVADEGSKRAHYPSAVGQLIRRHSRACNIPRRAAVELHDWPQSRKRAPKQIDDVAPARYDKRFPVPTGKDSYDANLVRRPL